eukprot:scaffold10021_cov20-Tisochrysis_lutea.AAC.5
MRVERGKCERVGVCDAHSRLSRREHAFSLSHSTFSSSSAASTLPAKFNIKFNYIFNTSTWDHPDQLAKPEAMRMCSQCALHFQLGNLGVNQIALNSRDLHSPCCGNSSPHQGPSRGHRNTAPLMQTLSPIASYVAGQEHRGACVPPSQGPAGLQ